MYLVGHSRWLLGQCWYMYIMPNDPFSRVKVYAGTHCPVTTLYILSVTLHTGNMTPMTPFDYVSVEVLHI